ncbi:WD40 repeat-like protein [Delitschia confertaspora ATCC 74209]|uniref:WD40 repeat-like protein n=1 Tax=Delitschia confertaspora ATCC 74209 TaxID=1513339 RepID=A0A9P4MUQ6_9PLEO|nr:WD40 repeat-like protein [Delitschia confertaspora ATCC 74209]
MQRPALPTANNGQTAPTVITIIPPSVPPNLLSYGSLHWAQQEDYLLIYLKEVLQLTWLEIIEHYPNRTRASIQTHYSSYLNKRDRSKDPLDLTQAISAVRGDTTVPAVATISTPVKVPPSIVPKPATARNPSVQQVIPSQESVLSLNRPRRSTQPVNYTWPRRNQSFMMHPEESTEDGRQDQPHSRSLSIRLRSSEPSEEPAIVPETAYPVDKPLELNVEEEDAKTALAASQPRVFPPSGTQLPYLDSAQRQLLHKGPEKGEWDLWSGRDWQGTILHVDFHDEELELVERMAVKVMGPGSRPQFASIRRRIQRMLKNEPAHRIFKLSHEIVLRMNSRDRSSIDAFLRDAANGQISTAPRIERIGAVRQSRAHSSNPRPSTSSLLRQRELGLQSRRGWKDTSRPLSYQMKNNIFDTMGPAYSYTGASSDVHTVAWSPDGQCFAAGAVCVTDPDSMQYNRPNNLLYGDVTNKVIHELADHYTARYRPEKGANASHAMFASQDPKLYTTVSMVEFSPDGQYMYSTGYDRYAVMWETKSDGSQPESLRKFLHRAPVDLLTVSCNGLVATAAKKWTARSIKVMTIRGPEDIHNDSFTSSKAIERPDMKVLPTALKFEPNYGRLLLGGFGANVREDGLDSSGDICLWDVTTQQQLWVHGSTKNVFDLAFNPRQREAPFFAVGCVAGGQVNRGTRSVVRFYDCRVQGAGKYSMMMELECPALDMNDVVYCPYDDALFAAGCTDGSAYVWDVRKPDSFLYKLSHGKPLMQLDENQPREVTDTGIRFCSWGENSTRLFTGSSDGVVKIWDVARATDDVFIKDIATFDSGVMSGAFSPDKSRLVVGEVNGSVNVLEVGRDDCSVKNTERLRYVAYEDLDEPDTPFPSRADAESGKAIAEEMLKSGQMVLRPMGGLPVYQAVQGPNYNGPWDSSWSAPPLRDQALFSQAAFNVNPGPQCDISACGDLSRMATFTAEEMGDSGRSKDRIPDEMRKLWFGTPSFGNEHIFTAVLGKTKCDRCNLPAIPDENIDSAETGNFCEFCSFDCFRCGAPVLPDYNPGEGPLSYARASALERIQCRNCKRAWEVGVLGYKCVQDKGDPDAADERDVPRLKGYGRDLARERFECGAENEDEVTTFGDEMNALSEYYLGLTVKRPESPL